MATYSVEFIAPAGFTSEAKELIREMTGLGWQFRLSSKGHAIGRAPGGRGSDTISISRSANKTNRGLQNAESVMRRWVRAQTLLEEPEGMAALEAAYADGDLNSARVISRGLAHKMTRKPDIEESIRAQVESDAAREQAAAQELADDFTGKAAVEEIVAAPALDTVGYTLTPWLAKKHPGRKGGERYPSSGVMERRFTNDEIDYVCAFPDCGWEADNPRSVSSHYGSKHTAQGEGTPWQEAAKSPVPDMAYTESIHREYTPTARLLGVLTDWLAEQEWDTEEELATLFLTWAHERPDLEDVERKPVEAMTAEEIVARVRMLVGQPLAVKVQSMEERVAELEAKLEQRTQERDTVTAELLQAQNDVDALAEIAESIRHRGAKKAGV